MPVKNSENPNTPKTNQGNDTNPIKNPVNEPGAEKPADDVQKHETNWFRRMNIGESSAGPSKRKSKKIGEDDEEEETELSEAAKLAKAAREKEINDIPRINRELEAKEAAERDAALLLESRRLHFPGWDYEKMKKEAITEPIEN